MTPYFYKQNKAKLNEVLMGSENIKKIDFLIKDEIEAVNGYNEVIEFFAKSKDPNKDLVIKQLQHIKEEEDEHIRELTELKTKLIDPSYAPQIKVLEEKKRQRSSKPKLHYTYRGPIYRFDKVVKWNWEGHTDAVSSAQALNQLRYQAGKALGLNVGSHMVKIDLDPAALGVDQDDDGQDFVLDEGESNMRPRCKQCGGLLDDSGRCPVCDEGEEDM